MKIKYSVLVGVLAAGVLAVPAFAGSTGATGGTKARIDNQAKDLSTTTVQGQIDIDGYWGNNNGLSGKVFKNANKKFGLHNDVDEDVDLKYSQNPTVYSGVVDSNYSNPDNDEVKALQEECVNVIDEIGRKAKEAGGRGSYYGHATKDNGDPDWKLSHKELEDTRTFEYVDNGLSGTAMLIGDSDYAASAYAASGVGGRSLVITGTYGTAWTYRLQATGYVSPIILDLDGDGKIEASNGKYMPHSADVTKSKHAVMFDFYGNGFPVVMEWVGSNDGLLCRPHKDGSIDGTCLFGVANGHDNGYEEMSALDIDRNGSLEGAELEGLMVWTDKNCNGAADQGEVASLESLGITSIGVTHNNYVGNYVRNGKSFKTFDWWPCVIDCRKVNLKKI